MSILDQLAIKHGTDKSSLHHGYADIYTGYLFPLKLNNPAVNLLELGFGGHEDPNAGGESARMWREYFDDPRARITVIDNEDKYPAKVPIGVSFYQASQDDAESLKWINSVQGDWDIIIDDASHISSLTTASFKILWPMLKPGGFYCVEDTHSSYHAWYYGYDDADPNPEIQGHTWMGFANRLMHQTHGDLLDEQYRMGYSIQYVHQYKDLTVIRKAGQ